METSPEKLSTQASDCTLTDPIDEIIPQFVCNGNASEFEAARQSPTEGANSNPTIPQFDGGNDEKDDNSPRKGSFFFKKL